MPPEQMPTPTNPPLPLNQYKLLSFDVYGTLIEYKSHILNAFQPLISRLPSESPYLNTQPSSTEINGAASQGSIEFLKLFQKHEDALKSESVSSSSSSESSASDEAKSKRTHPSESKRFDDLLTELWRRIASELSVSTNEDEARDFGSETTISQWPSFPGTVSALESLSKRYKLVALSNIDQFAWNLTSSDTSHSGLGQVKWTKVLTSEDYGLNQDTDADEAKLRTLLKYAESELGISKEHVLHVAQSLGHDQAPAKRLGISSVWIVGDGPRWGKKDEARKALENDLVGYAWKFEDLKQFAEFVEMEVGGGE